MADSVSNGKKGKGFAGLDSMVSDVSEDVAKSASLKSPPPDAPPSPHPPPERPAQQSSGANSHPSGPGKSGPSGLGWVILGVVVLVIWIANSGSGNKSQPTQSYNTPPSYSAPAPAAAPSPPAPAPVSDAQMPPAGRNNVLSVPQIRYCKREQIRIEAIESVINNAYDHEVDSFNAMVGDYNSRCGEFRYRRGNVELVERELATERASIASAAQSEWIRRSLGLDTPKKSPAPKSAPAAQKSRPKSGVV